MRKNLYTKTINDIKISENAVNSAIENIYSCLLYTSPSPRDCS